MSRLSMFRQVRDALSDRWVLQVRDAKRFEAMATGLHPAMPGMSIPGQSTRRAVYLSPRGIPASSRPSRT